MRGSTLQERYQLSHVVGRGGMAEVWAARDLTEHRDVAVKTVAVADCPSGLRREASIAAAIDHPGVVRVRDAGDDGATAFMVMDLIPGPNLAAALRDGPLPLGEALRIGAAVADALDGIHRSAVVHRDVSPANVVLAGRQVTLVDFGVAAADSERQPDSVAFGTAPYMAPEQVGRRPVAPATDVYALGCLLTALVAGRPPFTADRPAEVLRHHVRAMPLRLAASASGVPLMLEALVTAMLAKEPELRPSAGKVRDVLTLLSAPPSLDAPSLLRPVTRAGAARHAAPAADIDPESTMPVLAMLDALEGEGRRAG